MQVLKRGVSLAAAVCLFSGTGWTQSAISGGPFVTREAWQVLMKKELPNSLCAPRGFYLSCYKLEAATCRHVIRNRVEQCLEELKVPAQLDPERGGVDLAFDLGQCVATYAQTLWQNQTLTNKACGERTPWL